MLKTAWVLSSTHLLSGAVDSSALQVSGVTLSTAVARCREYLIMLMLLAAGHVGSHVQTVILQNPIDIRRVVLRAKFAHGELVFDVEDCLTGSLPHGIVPALAVLVTLLIDHEVECRLDRWLRGLIDVALQRNRQEMVVRDRRQRDVENRAHCRADSLG